MGMTIGIDIGGTFTDIVALDAKGNVASFTKVPSTPQDPGLAVISGVEKILQMSESSIDILDRVAHSSTVSLNAIIERKGARLGIMCTEGFGDILIIGRQKRTDMYDLFLDAETPLFLCPRERILGIPERLDASGNVIVPLDEAAVLAAAEQLIEREKVTAIAICYLFSYLDPRHEIATRDHIQSKYPDVKISISSEVDPQMREYERLVMTAFDAYLKPVAENYLQNLADSLERKSKTAVLQIMQSRGGIVGWRQAAYRPITTAMSGPAAGVIGGSHCGRGAGFSRLITVDIGGTSCDIALVTDGKPLVSNEGKLDKYPLRQQMVDVSCIGAGGGSIAWVDKGGALRVGPQSAGAFPGPACYARGGKEPTITDASVVLGYLNPEDFGCGELKLTAGLAHEALARVAAQIKLDVPSLALGMHRILNSMMADAIKLTTVNRGYDPRKFALLGLGGGGPVHAAALARSLGCGQAVIPPLPGVLCANGLLSANIEHEQARTFLRDAANTDPQEMERHFGELLKICADRMIVDGVNPDATRISRLVDARYASQSYDLQVELPDGPINTAMIDRLVTLFHDEHERIYGHAQRSQKVRFATLRAVRALQLAQPSFSSLTGGGDLEAARKGSRRALFDIKEGYRVTEVYDRRLIPMDATIIGPAILEQPDTTTLVYPGQKVVPDSQGNLIISSIE